LAGSERLLQLTAASQSFVFNDISAEPIPSLLRDFSAPVYLDFDYTPEQLTLCWPTTATRSTPGKPDSAWPRR
jgi:aminopeptidase N